MDKKECKWCKEEKELSEFYSQNKKKSNGEEYIYYHPECKVCTKKNAEEWRHKPENREKWLQINKNKNRQPKYQKMMKEASRLQRERGEQKKWRKENPEKISIYNKDRRHKNHDISDQEWFECLDFFNDSCAYCGISEEEALITYGQRLNMEHVDDDGVNDITNCVPSCKGCNSKKWVFGLNEWYNEDNPIYSKRRYNKIIKWLLSFAVKQIN